MYILFDDKTGRHYEKFDESLWDSGSLPIEQDGDGYYWVMHPHNWQPNIHIPLTLFHIDPLNFNNNRHICGINSLWNKFDVSGNRKYSNAKDENGEWALDVDEDWVEEELPE